MRNFQQKKGWQHIMHSRPVLIFLGVLLLIFLWSILGFWNKMLETGRNKKTIEEKVASLQQQKQKLSSDIDNLNTVEGKEKLFRENFGLAKDGEDLIVIVDDKNPPPPPKSTSSGFFSFFTNLFK